MKIAKNKYAALKAAAKRGGKVASAAGGAGVKAGAIQILSGAVTAYGNQKLSEASPFYRSQWWIGPAAIGVLGFLLKRKAKFAPVGNAMLGASGFALAQNYMFSHANTAASGDVTGMYGDDTGALYGAGDSYPSLNSSGPTASNAASVYDVSAAAAL